MQTRLRRLREKMVAVGADGVLVTKPENMQYFSGFSGGEGALVITEDEAILITDFRYTEQAEQETEDFVIVKQERALTTEVVDVLKKYASKILVEQNHMQLETYLTITKEFPDRTWVPTELDSLRIIKDEAEIELIKKAVSISDQAFTEVLSVIKAGMTEIEVAAELEYQMRKSGSERPAFPTIVASGVRGSLPHGTASDKIIQEGELVTMDFGAVYRGYHSDITRTVCVGKASQKQKELYHIVLDAQLNGLATVCAGKQNNAVDMAARYVITQHGYAENFGHGLGHGVGLEIHEWPRLSPKAEPMVLESGMVVTVEPGIYIPGFGGIRIEDTVVVTSNGCNKLTQSTKKLLEL